MELDHTDIWQKSTNSYQKHLKKKIKVFFTPHVIPMFRGILSTIYLDTQGNNNAKKIYEFL